MFDFSDTQATDVPRTLVVKHPATGVAVAEIDLISIDADAPKRVKRRQEQRRLKSRTPLKLDMDEIRADQLEVLAACTVAWREVTWKGAVLELSSANAIMLYDALPWLKQQVDDFVNDVAVFLES